jgi:hypothetical protein
MCLTNNFVFFRRVIIPALVKCTVILSSVLTVSIWTETYNAHSITEFTKNN